MTKTELQEFVTVSYDKLVDMHACEPGLKWFVENFNTTEEWPLSCVAGKLRMFNEFSFLNWYVCDCGTYEAYRLLTRWNDLYMTCEPALNTAYVYARYFALLYKIQELEEEAWN